MGERALFVEAVAMLVRRLHPDVGLVALASAAAEFRASLAVVDCPFSHDQEDSSSGSLTRADALRIRAVKFVVAQLPAGMFADPAVRRTIRTEVRGLVEAALGGLAPSRYLDPPARED